MMRASRQTLCRAARHTRAYCSSEATTKPEYTSLVIHRENDSSDIAQLQLRSKPVNSLDATLCAELVGAIKELEAAPDVRGVVLGSAVPNMYSAGLDLNEILRDVDERAQFWTRVQEMWLALYTTPLATVAAVSGHAPAGGCMLALACDARVMVGETKCATRS